MRIPATVALAAVLCFVAFVAFAGDDAPQFLFVQTAAKMTFADGTLTLHDVSPSTIFFSDRPKRIAGHGKTARFVARWDEGEQSFKKIPPNAVLSVVVGEAVQDAVIEIKNPRLDGETLKYDVKVLNGTMPDKGTHCSLFIDSWEQPAGAGQPILRHHYKRHKSAWGHPAVR